MNFNLSSHERRSPPSPMPQHNEVDTNDLIQHPGLSSGSYPSHDRENTSNLKRFSKSHSKHPSPVVPVTLPPLAALDQYQQRQLRSFLRNFLSDESGTLCSSLDLGQHAIDSGIAVSDATVHEVVHMLPKLQSLSLATCLQITDASLWAIANKCLCLETLSLSKCTRFSELGLRLVSHECPLLHLDLSDCPQVNDKMLQAIAAGCWSLEVCRLRRCVLVSDAGLVHLAQCCRQLLELDVAECCRIGEFGDKALGEIGRNCFRLETLDLFGCRHVRDGGLRSVARGCTKLKTLRLSGCREVTGRAIREVARCCQALHDLSLAGCAKTSNQDLRVLASNCRGLTVLDISGSDFISSQGVRCLAEGCSELTKLTLDYCTRIDDTALEQFLVVNENLKSQTTNKLDVATRKLEYLSVVSCRRIREPGVDVLLQGCPNLTTLNVSGCDRVSRRFMQFVISRLEVVEWASTFFGFQPLPHADEIVRQRRRKEVEHRAAVLIQAAMRGCLARGGLWEAKMKYVQTKVLPRIQGMARGFLVRRRIFLEQEEKKERAAARQISQAYQDYRLRGMLARAKLRRRLQMHLDLTATEIQRVYRGHRARCFYRKMLEAKLIEKQMADRLGILEELCAIKLQRAYRGHCGRHQAALARTAKEMAILQAQRESDAIAFVQRVFRGHRGRKEKRSRLMQKLFEERKQAGACALQRVVRGHWARQRVRFLRQQAFERRRMEAASTIQRYWRGLCEKHLASLLRGLLKLHAREVAAACTIQTAYRMQRSKALADAIRLAREAERRRKHGAIQIQRFVRGHIARSEVEARRELQRLHVQAAPLFEKETRITELVQQRRKQVEDLTKKCAANERDEHDLTDELEKTMQIKTKYHDSSRISGTPQRYLTQYLQVQLADQLRAKRMEMAMDNRSLETAVDAFNEANKKLRVVRRQLEPLTAGAFEHAKLARTRRLHNDIRWQRYGALTIQRVYRGYRLRVALAEKAEYWTESWNASTQSMEYLNTYTGDCRHRTPIGLNLFKMK